MRVGGNQTLKRLAHRSVLWLKIAVLIFVGLAPAFMGGSAAAAQLTPRSITLGSSQSNFETTYKFDFTMPSATPVQGVIFEFCDAPLGTCTKPNAMDVFTDTVVSAQSGFAQAGSFSVLGSASNDCNIAGSTADTKVCVTRTQTTAESGGTPLSITLGDILNPTLSGVYLSVYIRISIYSDTAFQGANKVHEGTVAAAITQRLTSVGRVAERLIFCVGAIDDDATMPSSCDDGINTFPTETTIDLGIISNSSVTASPVDPSIANANLSNDRFGLLMVNTNASGGVVVTYFPEEASSVSAGDTDQLRSFRVLPTDCSASPTSTTDQCFISADGTTGETFSANTERFGMAVACISNQGTTDNFDPTNNGFIGAAYDGDGDFDDDNVGFVDDCENESIASYTWGFDDSGAPATLASTVPSNEQVVDDEAIKLRFGAIASPTTPTGTYAVTTTYIATATF